MIASQTNYNGVSLLQESATSTSSATALTFQVGELSSNTIEVKNGAQANTVAFALSGLSYLQLVV